MDRDAENESDVISDEEEQYESEVESQEDSPTIEDGALEEDEKLEDYLLRYEPWRVDTLSKHRVTAVYVTVKAIAIGTESGEVFLLTGGGENLIENLDDKKRRVHDFPVRDVCVDEDHDYIASVCEGGVLFIRSTNGSDFYEHSFDRPLMTISLHPQYKHHEEKPFVCAGNEGRVLLSSRGFLFGNRKFSTLDEKCGKVFCTRWHGNAIAWATEQSIVIANAKTKKVVLRHSRGHDALRGDMFRCNMFWETVGGTSVLVVGWGNRIWQFRVSFATFGIDATAELLYCIELDKSEPMSLAGIAPYDRPSPTSPGHFVLLSTPTVDGWVNALEVCIIERTVGKLVVAETLALDNAYSAAPITQYLLAPTVVDERESMERAHFLLVTPSSGNIRISRVTDDDRVAWLLQRSRIEEAYAFITQSKRSVSEKYSKERIGSYLLSHLLQQEEFPRLAQMISEVIGDTSAAVQRWEKWIQVFYDKGMSHLLLPIVPKAAIGGQFIGKACYELLLNACLSHSISEFRRYVDAFAKLYEPAPICNAARHLLRRLRADKDSGRPVDVSSLALLGECVALLHEQQEQYGEALRIFRDLHGSVALFGFIERHHLEQEASDMLIFLYDKSKEHTMKLLLNRIRDVSVDAGCLAPSKVMDKLSGRPDFQWQYFASLMVLLLPQVSEGISNQAPYAVSLKRQWTAMASAAAAQSGEADDASSLAAIQKQRMEQIIIEFFQDIVGLFMTYAPDELHPFLVTYSDLGDIQRTMELCRFKGFIEEVAFLMAKSGQWEAGMTFLVSSRKSVAKAVNFILSCRVGEVERDEMFRKLIETVLLEDSKLVGPPGAKFLPYEPQADEDWDSVSKRFTVEKDALMRQNGATTDGTALPRPVMVPINMIEGLLTAVASPQNSGPGTGIDPLLLVKKLPAARVIPNLGKRLTTIASSKKSHLRLMETIIAVLNGDIHDAHKQRLRVSRSAVVINGPASAVCAGCQDAVGTNNLPVTVFRCGHRAHCACALRVYVEKGDVKAPADSPLSELADSFFRSGGTSLRYTRPRVTEADDLEDDRGFPYCIQCSS